MQAGQDFIGCGVGAGVGFFLELGRGLVCGLLAFASMGEFWGGAFGLGVLGGRGGGGGGFGSVGAGGGLG